MLINYINHYQNYYVIEKNKDYVFDFLCYLNKKIKFELVKNVKSIIVDKFYQQLLIIKIKKDYIKWLFNIDLIFPYNFISKLNIYSITKFSPKTLSIEYNIQKRDNHKFFKYNNINDYINNKYDITMYELMEFLNISFSHYTEIRLNNLLIFNNIKCIMVIINNEYMPLYFHNQINNIVNIIL